MSLIPVVMEPTFKRRLKKKPDQMQDAIIDCVLLLGANVRHPGLHTNKVRGTKGVFEARVDKANRVTFHYEEGNIVMRNHCNHDIVKRNP